MSQAFAALRLKTSFADPLFESQDDVVSLSESNGTSKSPMLIMSRCTLSDVSTSNKSSASSLARSGSGRSGSGRSGSGRLCASARVRGVAKSSVTPEPLRSPRGQSTNEETSEENAQNKALEAKYQDMNYFVLARIMRNEISVKDRVTTLPWKTVKMSFRAIDATKYLVRSVYASNTAEAKFLCEQLISQGHIYDAFEEQSERDFRPESKRLYRFAMDDRTLESLQVDTAEVQKAIEEAFVPFLKTTQFEGRQLVSFLLERGKAANRSEGLKIGQLLLEEVIIARAGSNSLALFRDSSALYKLAKPLYAPVSVRKRLETCGDTEFEPASGGLSFFGRSLSYRRISLPSYAFDDLDEAATPCLSARSGSMLSKLTMPEPKSDGTRISSASEDRAARQTGNGAPLRHSGRVEVPHATMRNGGQSCRGRIRGNPPQSINLTVATSSAPVTARRPGDEAFGFASPRSRCEMVSLSDDYGIDVDVRLDSDESECTAELSANLLKFTS
ncbi:hypothetical protein FVE85_7906 [Porphyridium purpureum]|uniref:DEP domain-containing protein n=1 Tax=Porphyridium purpureum TaxID=35688 RepID=A0A5J4YLP0_PORPP|nr:hypothetical protein FVE85_7906 [Porphyridium purpureum]|eukprot:POR0988..scf295_9